MEGSLLSEADFACPICLDRLKDPFVTQCGHSFCYSCIITQLQNKSVCPCCSEYLTQDKVFPNYLLNKAVENVARAKLRAEGSLVQQLHAAIESQDAGLGLPEVEALLESLEEKRSQMQKQKKENNLELLLHFLHHSKTSKVKKLVELQGELHILDKDIHHVETRQQRALPAPAHQQQGHHPPPALPTLPTLDSHTWLQGRMQARGGERVPSVTVEDVSTMPGASGLRRDSSQEGGVSALGVGGGSRGSPSPHPLARSGSATAPSSLYQPNGQHLSASVLGLDAGAAGRTATDDPAQAMEGLASGARQHMRQTAGLHPGGPRPQGQDPGSAAHTHTTSLPPLHSPSPGRSSTARHPTSASPWPPPTDPASTQGAAAWGGHSQTQVSGSRHVDANEPSSGMATDSGTNASSRTSSGAVASGTPRPPKPCNKRPFESQYEDLQQHYLRMRHKQMGESKRRRVEASAPPSDADMPGAGSCQPSGLRGPGEKAGEGEDARAAAGISSDDGESIEAGDLQEFSRMLSMTTRRSKLEVIASMPGAGQNTSAAILSSVAFDKHALNFATAGVSKRISVYNYADAVTTYATGQTGEVVDQPSAQLRSRSKLSCLSWSCYQEAHLMSSDYEGVITLWDTHTLQPVTEYEAHNKRVWSVDFCPCNPQLLASGSDDGCVKVWAMNQSSSVTEIDLRANVCSVKYSPVNEHELAVGSADHNVLLFDTRRHATPLHVFSGHKKAVSYVVYMSDKELVSASTDSSLRLWSIADGKAVRSYAGHINEKNFVGLSAEGDFVACGSETSQIYVFYRAMSRPIARTLFSPQPARSDAATRSNSQFISALCWKPRSEQKILVAANSQGAIKILQLQCS